MATSSLQQPLPDLHDLARLAALDDTQEDNFADLDGQQHPLVLRMAHYAGSQGLGSEHGVLLSILQDVPEALRVPGSEHPTGVFVLLRCPQPVVAHGHAHIHHREHWWLGPPHPCPRALSPNPPTLAKPCRPTVCVAMFYCVHDCAPVHQPFYVSTTGMARSIPCTHSPCMVLH